MPSTTASGAVYFDISDDERSARISSRLKADC